MPAKLWFVARRALQVIPVVLAIAALNFLLLHLAPGDAADIIAAQSGGATPEFVAELRRSFGLDRPLYQQFFVLHRAAADVRPRLLERAAARRCST